MLHREQDLGPIKSKHCFKGLYNFDADLKALTTSLVTELHASDIVVDFHQQRSLLPCRRTALNKMQPPNNSVCGNKKMRGLWVLTHEEMCIPSRANALNF
ncbi:hypothetical protein Bpfe_021104 [Biomphalaria pfeifferi]|uniref:Uncharacterized protein n=1 Tax=Biomphalaria pfeifferi TaxID=112525 RepID=A0AAD8B7B1_BIOPF|nr:hypothetical protein Bpfe_021104 [Biomphalaria pfeifferi]